MSLTVMNGMKKRKRRIQELSKQMILVILERCPRPTIIQDLHPPEVIMGLTQGRHQQGMQQIYHIFWNIIVFLKFFVLKNYYIVFY